MTDFAAARTAMVDCQVRPSDVTKYPIISAFLEIPREEFVPGSLRETSYVGEHLKLDDGRIILDPRSFAKMLDAVAVTQQDLVLDIGAGLGYSAAVIAKLAEAVVAVEDNAEMAAEASETLSAQSIHNVVYKVGPLIEGDADHGPYDAIILEGGIETLPQTLISQLKDGGRVGAIFVSGAVGQMKLGTKRGDKITWRTIFDTVAPLIKGFEAERGFQL